MTRASPFDHLRAALDRPPAAGQEIDGVRPDLLRASRTGIPEVVYCQGKSPEAVISAFKRLAASGDRVVGTRCTAEMADQVTLALNSDGLTAAYEPVAQAIVVSKLDAPDPGDIGVVGLLTAGTSDWPAAAVAKLIAEGAGCRVLAFQDCGVAGLHRLVGPLEALIEAEVSAIIVAAGMDGVLPSVVAGLVDIPVIGLPTSTGYGHGGAGEGALTTMLQSCAPGVSVVNIDNGVGAGAIAALIAMRVSRERDRSAPAE